MHTAYVADTPNGRKLIIALEELGLDYRIHHADLGAGGQFAPEFLQIRTEGIARLKILENA